MLIVDSFSSTV